MLTWFRQTQRVLRANRRDNTVKLNDDILRVPKERITSWEQDEDSGDVIIFAVPDPRILEFLERMDEENG